MKQNGSNELKQHSEDTAGNSLLSPGALLQEARHLLGLSQAEVARRLCLNIKIITNIERDEYKELPGLSYIRGYLRSYANLVNISADKVLQSFERQGFVNNFTKTEKPQIKSEPSLSDNKDNITRLIGYILIIVFIAMSLGWWYEHRGSSLKIINELDTDLTALNHHINKQLKLTNLAMKPELAFYPISSNNLELKSDNIFGKPYLVNSN